MSDMLSDICKLDNDHEVTFEGYGVSAKVTYSGRQAYGDNGQPVPGDTVGHFTVAWQGGRTSTHEHGPSQSQRFMVACRVKDDIVQEIFRAKFRQMDKAAGR